MLAKMHPKRIPRIPSRLVSGRDPRAPLNDVMLRVVCGGGEIIVDGVHLKPVKGVDGRLSPLPHVSDNIVEFGLVGLFEHVDGAGGRKVLEVDVARGLCPLVLVGLFGHEVAQVPVLVLGGQANGLSSGLLHPLAKCLCLEIVHIHRPVPRHLHDLSHGPIVVTPVRPSHPEDGRLRLLVAHPPPPLLRPVILVHVTAPLHKLEILPVGHKVLACLEGCHSVCVRTVLVIPPVKGVLERLAQRDLATRNLHELVLRCRAGLCAPLPKGVDHDVLKVHLTDKNAGRLKVNALMFNPHHDDPQG
eukprot:comp22168_c0_seq1/m.32523 comp22168_c0_seq1/g.32523  ORF comp22168_c0_seq1/g.32523 comp22168_c0_seq1/m.32523 type:complete len:302 (+) comp22168_c0_seq1:1522-2427(+)